ncbi:MAG TPA: LAGLIDADG family homing endonuclease [Nitrososphaerales archaeon]|nr:LAGLIDADG family homing endonuclease [Nitrososphaerales archaeon]
MIGNLGSGVDAGLSEQLRKLYWGQHLTIRQIAQQIPTSRTLVRNSLLELGPLRAARKNRKPWSGTFSGEENERAYLMGLRAGDLNAFRQSSQIIVGRVSTTHQALLELFQQTFAPYGQCIMEPRKVFLTGYDWQIKIHLDNSFEFLIEEPLEVPTNRVLLYEFIAGLSDSDGCWCLFEDKGKTACAFMISSQSKNLLVQLKKALEKECFHVYLYHDRMKGVTKIMHGVSGTKEIKLKKDSWRLDIHRREEVRMLARRLLPLSRHREKMQRMCLVLDEVNELWESMGLRVAAIKNETKEQTGRTIKRAEIEYKARHPMAGKGGRRLDR